MIAAVGWIAFVLLPGAALAVAVAPGLRRRPVLLVAVSPALAFALSMGVAFALELVGAGPWPWVAAVDGLVVLVAGVRLRGARESGSEGPGPESGAVSGPTDPIADRQLARWLLGAAVVVGLAVWLVPGSPSVPKNRDVQNHGYFVARIAYENSVAPAIVLAESPTNPEQVADFYPLAAHTTMAVAQRATGVPIADILLVWPLMAAVLTLPFGLFALVRRLLPHRPAVAGWAALAGACTALFPYQPMTWGGIAFTIGLSLVPGVLALALVSVDAPARGPAGTRSFTGGGGSGTGGGGGGVGMPGPTAAPLVGLAAVAVAGAALVHTSQLALLVLVMGAFAVHDVARARTPRTAPLARWALLAGLCAVLVSPAVTGVLAGAGERSDHTEVLSEGPDDVIRRLVALDIDEGPAQVLVGALAIAGIALLVADRKKRPLGRIGALMAAMGLLALLFTSLTLGGSVWEPLRVMTLPWYRSWWRLPYNLALFAPLFVGVVLEWSRTVLIARAPWARMPALAPLLVAPLLVATVFVALALPASLAALDHAGVRNELFTTGQQAMVEGLARETRDASGQQPAVVLNQENDGTAWAYITDQVPAFSGLQGLTETVTRERREWLLEHAEQLADSPEVAELFERWNVRYVLVRDNSYEGEPAALGPEELMDADGFALRDHQDSLWLFEVTL